MELQCEMVLVQGEMVCVRHKGKWLHKCFSEKGRGPHNKKKAKSGSVGSLMLDSAMWK